MSNQTTPPRPRLTRAEARMIAEEVVRLMREQNAPQTPPEEYLTAREAAEYLNVSVWYVYHNIDSIPHATLPGGKRKMFLKSRLAQYVESRR